LSGPTARSKVNRPTPDRPDGCGQGCVTRDCVAASMQVIRQEAEMRPTANAVIHPRYIILLIGWYRWCWLVVPITHHILRGLAPNMAPKYGPQIWPPNGSFVRGSEEAPVLLEIRRRVGRPLRKGIFSSIGNKSAFRKQWIRCWYLVAWPPSLHMPRNCAETWARDTSRSTSCASSRTPRQLYHLPNRMLGVVAATTPCVELC
jgi:hypothetical protein